MRSPKPTYKEVASLIKDHSQTEFIAVSSDTGPLGEVVCSWCGVGLNVGQTQPYYQSLYTREEHIANVLCTLLDISYRLQEDALL